MIELVEKLDTIFQSHYLKLAFDVVFFFFFVFAEWSTILVELKYSSSMLPTHRGALKGTLQRSGFPTPVLKIHRRYT